MTFSAILYEMESFPRAGFCRRAWEHGRIHLKNDGGVAITGREITLKDLLADDWTFACEMFDFTKAVALLESRTVTKVRRMAWKRDIEMHLDGDDLIVSSGDVLSLTYPLSIKDVMGTDWMVCDVCD